MNWSKFNYMYFSDVHQKHLLYNSLSNAFIDISNPELLNLLTEISITNKLEFLEPHEILRTELIQYKILVDSDECEILKIKHRIRSTRYSDNTIILTLLPTLACNFKCPYCFAKLGNRGKMEELVQNSIVKLVEMLSSNNKQTLLNLTWMGGEPLVAYKEIQHITYKLQKLNNIQLRSSIVTNGYLLDKDTIDELPKLNIHHVQVTIDGLEEEHNLTRIHKTKSGTFQQILNNLDIFFATYNQQGTVTLNIRVNLDKTKDYIQKFISVYVYFYKRYPYENLFISPGFIEDVKANGYKPDCEFSKQDIASFYLQLFDMGLKRYELYPKNQFTECAVRSSNEFVVGPQGEIYTCWENIGYKDTIIGYLNENGAPVINNPTMYYRYLLDADYLEDKQCLNCFFFPVCDGGCPEKRIRNKHCNACFNTCTLQQNNLNRILDAQYEIKRNLHK